jgi:hypothetical protein
MYEDACTVMLVISLLNSEQSCSTVRAMDTMWQTEEFGNPSGKDTNTISITQQTNSSLKQTRQAPIRSRCTPRSDPMEALSVADVAMGD